MSYSPTNTSWDLPVTFCAVCFKTSCSLATHKDYVARQLESKAQASNPSVSLSPSFASSYAFNPLSVAIEYVCGETELDIDGVVPGAAGLSSALHTLIYHDIECNVPFTSPTGHSISSVAAEWLIASSLDELACTTTLNLWLMINWRLSRNPNLLRCSARLAEFFVIQLRKRVENEVLVTAGTLFAASNHLTVCLIFFDQDDKKRENLMNGLEILVDACGGFETVVDTSPPGVVQSLLWSDALYSCYTGSKPRFWPKPPPSMPRTLIREFGASSVVPTVYQRCCTTEILTMAKHLKFFLLFRQGSGLRSLSREEYQYMIALERSVHVQLLDQSAQYRYPECGSINECLAIALGLVRMSVLCTWEQHVQTRRIYRQRLVRALEKVSLGAWLEAKAVHALMWVCWVILAQSELLSQTPQDLRSIIKLLSWGLRTVLGEDSSQWPTDWAHGFRDRYQPLIWHTDYDQYIPMVSEMVLRDFIGSPQSGGDLSPRSSSG